MSTSIFGGTMGGRIAVGVRFLDDRIVVQDRWTNTLPYWFRNTKIYRGDQAHIEEYIATAQNPKTVPLAPIEYGLVFLDFKTNHLLSMQGYTNLDNIDGFRFSLLNLRGHSEDRELYQSFIDERRLRLGRHRDDSTIIQIEPITGSIEELIQANHRLMQQKDNNNEWIFYQIDTSPVTFIDYEVFTNGNRKSSEKLKVKLKELEIAWDENVWQLWEREGNYPT